MLIESWGRKPNRTGDTGGNASERRGIHILKRLENRPHDPTGHACLLESADPFGGGFLPDPPGDRLDDAIPMSQTACIRGD